jgi:hypothetical protein
MSIDVDDRRGEKRSNSSASSAATARDGPGRHIGSFPFQYSFTTAAIQHSSAFTLRHIEWSVMFCAGRGL